MKKTDWISALHAYLEEVRHTPFQYGTHDCGIFTSGAIIAMTGEDPAAVFRGRYKTHIGALRAMRKSGFTDQHAIAASLYDEIRPAFASTGDICTMPGSVLGVCVGDRVAVAGEHGLLFASTALIERSFRV